MSIESEMKQPTTKTCQHCRTEIDRQAHICPACRSKQPKEKGLGLVIVGALGFILIVGGANSGGKSSSSPSPSSTSASLDPLDPGVGPQAYRDCVIGARQDGA